METTPDFPTPLLSETIRIEFSVKDQDSEDFETYLYDKDVVVNIMTTLIDENELNTFSSFNIDNGAVSGYFIERGIGTYEEERTDGSLKRIPGNEYDVIENDCNYRPGYQTDRPNCANEFRLITTPEKSGTRSGILVHTGITYLSSTGCLVTSGSTYTTSTTSRENVITGESTVITIYNTNGSSTTTLNAINTYIEQKKRIAENNNKTLKITIDINR